MNVTFCMGVPALGIVGLNFLHWLKWKDSRLLYTPRSGWFRIGLVALTVGIALWLFLPERIPDVAFLALLFGLTAAGHLYSIWCRHRQHSA